MKEVKLQAKAGAASSMRDFVIPLPISESLREKAIDIVGTGGDKSYSFNISSTVSFTCKCWLFCCSMEIEVLQAKVEVLIC